jgi:polar amino acid transport system substrate-binding protein
VIARRPGRSLAAALIGLCLLAPLGGEPAGVLRVCADPDNLPFSSAVPGGDRGLYVDVAELVAARLGLQTEYAWYATFFGKRAVRNTLLADRCDAFFGLPSNPEFMARNVALTRPFVDVGYAVVVQAPRRVASLDDLKGARVAVVFRTPAQYVLASRSDIEPVTFRTDDEALAALAAGQVDAAFVWGPTAGYDNVRRRGGTHRIVPISGEGLQWKAAVAVRRADDGLRRRIDEALGALQPEIDRLADVYGLPRVTPVAGDAGAGPGTSTDTGAAAAADVVAQGRSVFNQHCSHCHAPNAMSPEPSRDLRRLRRRYGDAMAERFYATVTQGRPDKGMPRWGETLERNRIDAVWAFLQTVQLPP